MKTETVTPSFTPISREDYSELRGRFIQYRDKSLGEVVSEWKRIGELLDQVFREQNEEVVSRLIAEIGAHEFQLLSNSSIEHELIVAMWGEEAAHDDNFLERFVCDFDLSDGAEERGDES